jgi:hypothetical protein
VEVVVGLNTMEIQPMLLLGESEAVVVELKHTVAHAGLEHNTLTVAAADLH